MSRLYKRPEGRQKGRWCGVTEFQLLLHRIVLACEQQAHRMHVVCTMLFFEHVEDLATIAASFEALVSRAEHEVDGGWTTILYRGPVSATVGSQVYASYKYCSDVTDRIRTWLR